MKFVKESRMLTIALSLLLCAMIGVVWAVDDCPVDGDEWGIMDGNRDNAWYGWMTASDEGDFFDDMRQAVVDCEDQHGGHWNGWYEIHLDRADGDGEDAVAAFNAGVTAYNYAQSKETAGDDECGLGYHQMAAVKYLEGSASFVSADMDFELAFLEWAAGEDDLDNAIYYLNQDDDGEDCGCSYP